MLKKTHLRQFWSENRWLLLGLAWLLSLALGFIGFYIYAIDNGEGWTAGDTIYRTFQLVAMNSGAVDGEVNWFLQFARFLLPLLTLYTVFQALMQLFVEQTQKLRLRRLKAHVVICGLGRKGSRLAEELLSSGQQVVIIEKELRRENAEIYRKLGAIILDGDATNKDMLTSARILHARNLVCLVGGDSENLQIAYQAYQLTRTRRSGKLTCIIHLSSIDLLNLIRSSELSTEPGVPFELETFNPYKRTARILLQDNPGWRENSQADDIPASLLVVGLGRLGEQLVIMAGYLWHLLNRQGQLCIIVVDRDALEKTQILFQKYPQLGKVCELIPMQVDLSTAGPLQNFLVIPGEQVLIQQAYICLRDPVLSLQVCLNLLQIPDYITGPIRVQLTKEAGLVNLLENPLPGFGDVHRVKTFDFYDYSCSTELILGGLHELLARDLHEVYRTNAESDSTQQTWDQLTDAVKDANRRQTARLHHLLNGVGYRIYPLQDWDADKRTFSKTEIEKMACLEHDLWRQAKEADGWIYGEQRDENKHTHPDLVSWDDLPQEEREKNLAVVRQMPALLARVGFQIDRVVKPRIEPFNS
jgi:predicted ThiF/HesA family dinucleotide-utilizing enzyme